MKDHFFRRMWQLVTVAVLMIGFTSSASAAPSIALTSGNAAFGNVGVNATLDRTFSINNSGDATANLSYSTLSAPFSFNGTPPTSVAAGASVNFTVRFSPTARQAYTGTLTVTSAGSGGSPIPINLSGTGVAPDIAVTPSSPVTFGNVIVGSSSSETTFTISNNGNASLTAGSVTISGAHAGDFSVTAQPSSPVAAGSNTTFKVNFTPTMRGSRTATLQISHNDPLKASPHQIAISGTGLAPEIKVWEKNAGGVWVEITNGSGTSSFGDVTVGYTLKKEFRINNVGTASLVLQGANPITISGVPAQDDHSADFKLAPATVSTIAVGGSALFNVEFTPSSASASGNRAAVLKIANNDPGASPSPFEFTLAGNRKASLSGDEQGAPVFGYKYVQIPATAVALDPAAPDVNVAALSGDDMTLGISLGFNFSFYENSYSSCWISTNGLMGFSAPSNRWTPETSFPNGSDLKNIIAPFWTDLVTKDNSKILYATRGAPPNRRLILDYQNMGEYSNSSGNGNVSFQLILYEGSNTIEFHYMGFGDFNSPLRSIGRGIENETGTSGLTLTSTPTFPSAVQINRPVVVKVESNYFKPGDDTPVSMGLNDPGGDLDKELDKDFDPKVGEYREPYNSTKRFNAPNFVYLDQNFKRLPGAGDVSGPADQVAWYRLVNDGYAINGQTVQGARTFVEVTLDRDMTFVWRWELEYAVNIKFVGAGTPVPAVGRSWYKRNQPLTASVDNLVESDAAGVRVKTMGYRVTAYNNAGTTTTSEVLFANNPGLSVGTRNNTKPMTILAPLEIEWVVTGQVRYRFSANSATLTETNGFFDGLPFVRVYSSAPGSPVTTYGSGSTTDVWINSGDNQPTKVEVGAFYRTADDSHTLSDFTVSAGGDLAPLGTDISGMADVTMAEKPPLVGSRLARLYTINFSATVQPQPTEISWVYRPTLFRAEVPLGMPFDPTQTIPPLVRTVPPLNNRVLSDAGPVENYQPVGDLPTGKKSPSQPLRWDQVDLKLYPVQPATHRFTWKDKNDPSKTYNIEVVSGYPGAVVNLTSERENPNGTRQGTAPDYITKTTLPTIDVTNPGSGFPGVAENAHYIHLFDAAAGRRPPTKLDISSTDEWKFQDMPYADDTNTSATMAEAGVPFRAQAQGRSVVLYSYRPNTDEIADGDLSKEKLAVRVVRSNLITEAKTITTNVDNPKLVLGQYGLELGGGTAANRGAFGVIRPSGSSTVDLGTNFVIDFWLNIKGLHDVPVAVANCVTNGTDVVVCESTAGLVAGMRISGATLASGTTIASITNATTFTLSQPSDDSGTALSLTASGKPVTILSTKDDKVKLTLDPEGPTLTLTYFDATVSQVYPVAGSSWRHHILHVFANQVPNGPQTTVMSYYIDGERVENGFVTTTQKGISESATFDVGSTLTANSLRFGVDADPTSQLQMDQFRLFTHFPLSGISPVDPWLSAAEIRQLRFTRRLTAGLRSMQPQVWFNFEKDPILGQSTPLSSTFGNSGISTNLQVGPATAIDGVSANENPNKVYAGTIARVNLEEVATRLESTLDAAGFSGSGYILNEVSNYNASLYNRGAEIGAWGTIFPVNDQQLFTSISKRLEVAYYENPYRADPYSHPNVAWPYEVVHYMNAKYPVEGPHKDKAIYIASRIGSEGVDQKGRVQKVFRLDQYENLAIYNQPNKDLAGYNPNEEHALVAPSGRAALKLKNLGEDVANNPPLAAFALQAELNAKSPSYSSAPWVLVQVNDLVNGEPEMAAYQVFKTRTGGIDFPRPADTDVTTQPGLAYEAAATPEDRFLTTDTTKTFDFTYRFQYNAFAGDLLIPPYPLNIVIGNVAMADARGNSIQVNGKNQRALWRDVNKNAWVVSGKGQFFHQYFYPFRGDFYLPQSLPVGTPVAWVPAGEFTGTGTSLEPVKVVYDTFWRSDYPKLKRGETVTYQGGEYLAETPGAKGVPAIVAMKAAEIVYDSATPSMTLSDTNAAGQYDYKDASARIMRPLDRREVAFTVADMASAGFTPAATSKIFVVAERWYFKDLPGSLQKRFYFDSLAQKIVFRGYLNDKDSGNKDLTLGPDPLNILEPNVLSPMDIEALKTLSGVQVWLGKIDTLVKLTRDPHNESPVASFVGKNIQGLKATPADYPLELKNFFSFLSSLPGLEQFFSELSPYPKLVHLDSYGVGSALVPNANLLTQAPTEPLYITVAENNRSELDGAPVSLHIIEILPDRYRGAIKVIEAADAFSEKISLQHNGEFGGNTEDLYYEWWIRDATALDEVALEVLPNGNLKEYDTSGNSLWQEYLPKSRLEDSTLTLVQKHLGLNSIVFEGRPDVVLADKLVFMRYRHKNEANWTLVPFEVANRNQAWKPGSSAPVSPAPFQWAGAANSPQMQADGSKRYIPQLVMGWVKRVLDRINPYEARYTDFFGNESPATYSSQIQIAGAPYIGKVALNPDKNVIENTGLIELYMTVLERAKELSIDNSTNGVASDGIKQALLLAATRLSVLYELLASEAYSDAQDSTINAGEDNSLLGIASHTHAFQNMEADLMHEELALLRGTDFLKSYPVYNRMFWNYAKGLGEAAYNVNYNIYDVDADGFINEVDARKLYPQGHGDAWGHYLSAVKMHYTLLQHPGFSWRSRSELYSLMQNVLEVDYLDEKTFAKLAAAKARTGRDIIRSTYRMKYTQNPDGQWQGYTDSADPARAWGLSEWAHRAGQAAWFDSAVANAVLPENAPGNNPENLDLLERSAAKDEIGEIVAGLHEIQVAMDEANNGYNPLGFDSDALTFDIELQFYDNSSGGDRRSHFEQVFTRAQETASNALTALEFATQAGNKLRALGDDTDALIGEAYDNDIDYRNRLIEIFGRPYTGTIGFGNVYPEGYEGPDIILFAYLDKIKINQIVPQTNAESGTMFTAKSSGLKLSGITDNSDLVSLYQKIGSAPDVDGFKALLSRSDIYNVGSELVDLSLPYTTASRYGFQAPTTWGTRTSYGTLQTALADMLADEIALDTAIADYIAFLREYEKKLQRLDTELAIFAKKEKNNDGIVGVRASINSAMAAIDAGISIFRMVSNVIENVGETIEKSLPTTLGFSNDVTSGPRGAAYATALIARDSFEYGERIAAIAKSIMEITRDEVIASLERDNSKLDALRELDGMLEDLESHIGNERSKRNAIGEVLQSLETHRQAYITAQAAGFSLLRQRDAFNKTLAAKVQKNRYQDMVMRMSRNEAINKYQTAFNHAARYTWLAARAYDYETSLDTGHPAAAGTLMEKIVKERQLGLWNDGEPSIGNGGLAEILAQLKSNFGVLGGQLGINNPQPEAQQISLRNGLFRIRSYDQEVYDAFDTPEAHRTEDQVALVADNPEAPASRARWEDTIKSRFVEDLNKLPEFIRHCRPVGSGVQPGLVIRFPTTIEPGLNFFGQQLAAGDHNYSTANYATKLQTFGVQLENYTGAGLSTTPRAYLVPAGTDYLRTSTAAQPVVRSWNVVEQRIPIPFTINTSNLYSPNYIPSLNGVDGVFGEMRRHGDFRMYHEGDGDEDTITAGTRLISRSVWNSEWLLIIPGINLHYDSKAGLERFAESVSDIKLYFMTYSHTGQ